MVIKCTTNYEYKKLLDLSASVYHQFNNVGQLGRYVLEKELESDGESRLIRMYVCLDCIFSEINYATTIFAKMVRLLSFARLRLI